MQGASIFEKKFKIKYRNYTFMRTRNASMLISMNSTRLYEDVIREASYTEYKYAKEESECIEYVTNSLKRGEDPKTIAEELLKRYPMAPFDRKTVKRYLQGWDRNFPQVKSLLENE